MMMNDAMMADMMTKESKMLDANANQAKNVMKRKEMMNSNMEMDAQQMKANMKDALQMMEAKTAELQNAAMQAKQKRNMNHMMMKDAMMMDAKQAAKPAHMG